MSRTLISRFIIFILAFTFATSYLSDALIKFQINELTSEYLGYESRLIAKSIDLTLKQLIENNDLASIQSIFTNLGDNPTIETMSLVDSSDTLIASYPEGQLNNMSDDANTYFSDGIHHTEKIEIVSKGNDNVFYMLDIKLSAAYERAVSTLIQRQIMYVYLAMQLVMIIGIIMIFYKLISSPISRLNVAAEEVKNSNYQIRIKKESDDEIGQLAKTFNEMTEAIETHMNDLSYAREKAENAAEIKMKFLANMSHEIRTPLNSVLGFSDLLYEMEDDSEKRAHLKVIQNSGDHLLGIINDILDFSKLETESLDLDLEAFTIRSDIYDVAKMFEMSLIQKGLKFSAEVTERVPRIMVGDNLRIKQIIINLMSNAVKFTKQGKINLNIDYDESILKLCLSDTGVGIQADKQEHIFDSFTQADYSTTRLYGGTGLGLAISKKLIEQMGGLIELTSEVGKGTRFVIKLPIKSIDQEVHHVFDGETMVKNWLGSDILVYDLILEAIKELPKYIKTLEEAVDENDPKKLFENAHVLKGLTGNFHMHELYEPSADLCESVRDYKGITNFEEPQEYLNELNERLKLIPEYYYYQNNQPVEVPQNVKPMFNKRILVAEDVYENGLLIKCFLRNITNNIDFAENGIKTLDLLESVDYDLLLLDMQMPYLSGAEIIEIVRKDERLKDLHIIVVTANATKQEIDGYLKLGCDYVIPKPVDKKILRRKVIEVFKSKHEE